MAFHTIWSVDLGKASLKAVKLRRDKNNVEILAIDKVDYPLGQNGIDASGDAAKEALSIFSSRNEIKDPVVVSHPGQGTFSRFIKIPAFEDKKVEEMVQYEASQQIPFPLDEVIWDYHIVDRDYLSGEERDVGLFAVRREAIDDFLLDFVQDGMSVEMLPIGYLALFNFIKYDLNPQEPSIVLDIGASHTDLIFIDGERFWVRPLPHSGQDITRAIMDRFKLKYSEAERLKTAAAKAPKQAAKIFQAVILPKLKELVQEVQRSLGYYRSQAGEATFERLYLLGNGSRIIGIKKYLQDQLAIPVERVQSIHRLRINRDVNVKLLQSQLPAFGTAFGGGLQALGVGACDVDLVPREEKLRKAAERKRKHVFFAALMLLGMVLLSYFLTSGKLREAEDALSEARGFPKGKIFEKDAKALTDVKVQEALLAKRSAILRISEARKGALDGLRLFDQMLSKLPNGEVVQVAATVGDAATLDNAKAEGQRALERKLWVPYYRATLIDWPEEDEKKKKRKPRGKKGKKDKPAPEVEKVPGYKFYAYAMVPFRGTQEDALKDIEKKLSEPLAQQLGVVDFTVLKDVKVGQGTAGFEALLFDPESSLSGGSSPVAQEGNPFFGAPLEWYVLPRAPKGAGEANESADEEPDPDDIEF